MKQGDKYAVFGEKTWCTLANKAHLLCTTVVTNPAAPKKHDRISILLIPKTPGDEFHPPQLAGSPIPTIGYKGMNSYALQFDGYEAPAENLLGGAEGKGFRQLMSTYEIARIQTAARAVGVAQAAFEAALSYSQERTQFGRPISEFQVIGHKLAHMATQIEAGRQLTYYAAPDEGHGQALRPGGGHGQGLLRGDGRARDFGSDADLRRLWLLAGVSRRSASGATRGCSASSRALRRSSTRSSPSAFWRVDL